MFNPLTNERFEVMPEVAKYDFARYVFVNRERDYTIFTSAKQLNEQDVEIQFYKYNIYDGTFLLFYTKVAKLTAINETYFIKVFALLEDYCIIEFIDILNETQKYELVVKNYNSKKSLTINNKLLNEYGLDKIVPLSGNLCAIKIGDEIIGTININRFVSDMIIGLDNIYIDVLDKGNGQFCVPYVRRYSDNLTYIKRDNTTGNEEIVIYDYENKVKKVRFNDNIDENSDLKKIYVINKTPYYFVNVYDGVSIVNLNTQKAEAELYNNLEVKFVSGDLIVACKRLRKHFFIGKEREHIEVYRFPDTKHSVYSINGQYGCCVEHFDNLLIFVN
ncbi:MAG: hypothetical protein IJB96_05140 [Lachnospira sp.]|nr:hypothetical protein [Lachnospira sp.]